MYRHCTGQRCIRISIISTCSIKHNACREVRRTPQQTAYHSHKRQVIAASSAHSMQQQQQQEEEETHYAASGPLSSFDQQQQLHAALQVPAELQDFRVNVGVCLINNEGLVFAATRIDDPGKSWQMPQGGIDPDETPLQAAVRELFEETNISSVEVLAEIPRWLPYEFPTEVKCKLSGSWAKYKGQAQRWFLMKFKGPDSEVNLDTAHREFSEWRWMPLDQLPAAVIHFKRGVYEAVAAEFGPEVVAMQQAAALRK